MRKAIITFCAMAAALSANAQLHTNNGIEY